MFYKVVNVTNPKNVLVQIPGAIVARWGVKEGDRIEVHVSENGNAIILYPKKIQERSGTDEASEKMVITL